MLLLTCLKKNEMSIIKTKQKQPERKKKQIKNNIKASTILSTLYEYENWLGQKKVRKYFKSSYEQDKIQCFSEFPVYTGSTKKSRRIDFLAVENMTTENLWELNIHGIEIKVTESDFINDEKYTEYTEFVDYFYLAVPEELKDIALKNKFKDCGLIVISKDKTNKFIAKVIEAPARLNPLRREDTLTSIALKLL